MTDYFKPFLAVDTETTGLSVFRGDKPFAISAKKESGETYFIETEVSQWTREPDWQIKCNDPNFLQIKSLIESPDTVKSFHNAKFDLRMLWSIGITPAGIIQDTALAAKICNSLEPHCGLKELCKKYLNIGTSDEDELHKLTIKARHQANKNGWKIANNVNADYFYTSLLFPERRLLEKYSIQDVIRQHAITQFYFEAMQELGVVNTYRKEMELLLNVIIPMETRGVRVFHNELIMEIFSAEKQMETTTREFEDICGDKLNLNSSPQIAEILTRKFQVPLVDKTPTGQFKTDQTTLKKFKDNPFVKKILEYSGLATGRGYMREYVTTMIPNHNNTEYSIHTNYKQNSTKTFRLSSSEPNIQNIANDETSSGENVTNCRKFFGPRDGYVWYMIDYAQVELRIFADRAQEPTLLNAFRTGRDPHNETRLKVPYLAAMPKERGRKLAKNTNFTIINVGGYKILNKKYSIPENEAQLIIKQFYQEFPRARARQYEIAAQAELNGFIYNAFNRKLMVDQNYSYRATSYDIQSGAADLIKRGMLKCQKFIKSNKLDMHLLLSIHDELIIEVNEKEDDLNLIKNLASLMANNDGAFSIETPVEVKKTSTNWSEHTKVIF